MPAPTTLQDALGAPIGTAGNPLPVTGGGTAAAPSIVGGLTKVVSVTPTVSASPAYALGDCIGGKMTFANMSLAALLGGMVQTAIIQCKSAQTFAADLILFHTDPSASTFTDNSALAVNAADFDKVLGFVQFAATTAWSNLGTPSMAMAGNLALSYNLLTTDLFGVLVSRGTPTLGSTSDIKVVLKALLD